MKSKFIFSTLPFDLIREILLFDYHFVLSSKKKLICINKILKNDDRFNLFKTIPKVLKLGPNSYSVILSFPNKKCILRYYLRPSQIWEYSFVLYSKDPHSNITNIIPDSMIYFPRYLPYEL